MTYRTVATLSVILAVVYGLAALIVPSAIGSVFGITFDTIAEYETRLLGGAYVGYGIVNFLTRDTADPMTQRAVAAANGFAWAVSFVVSALGQVRGLSNSIGWTTVLLALLFTIVWAWAYVAARERGSEVRRAGALT